MAGDDKLWQRITQSVKPLARDKRAHQTDKRVSQSTPAGVAEVVAEALENKIAAPVPQANPLTAKQGLPRHVLRRLGKHHFPHYARLDLHGLSRAEAQEKLHEFLAAAQKQGAQYVLVITGKGVAGQGVLRRALPAWLGQGDYGRLVLGFDAARPPHGGTGAFYVWLKKAGA